MSFLMLYIDDGRKFDQSAVMKIMCNWADQTQPCDDCLATYTVEVGDDFTIIRLKRDLETIVIDGSGESSLAAAMYIQSHYPDDIHVIDEGYSFDIVLAGISSLSELKRRIKDAGG